MCIRDRFDGDIIKIEQATESTTEAIELASTTLSPGAIKVNIIGEVDRPGPQELPANTPLIQGVLAAGGPKAWRANRGNVELVRINRNGTALHQRFALDFSKSVSDQYNPPLRDGDTVMVNRNGFAAATDALTAVSAPLGTAANVLVLVKLLGDNNNNNN